MKQALRKSLIAARLQMSKEMVEIKSEQIIKRIQQVFPLGKVQTIALYYPFRNEVNLLLFIEDLLKQGKKVALPKVLDQTTMAFYEVKDLNTLVISKFGIHEPNPEICRQIAKAEIDFMFVPGVGFNQACYRLGYGAGFYDRYLCEHAFPTVGVCFDLQITTFQSDSHDVPLDYVISETHLLERRNGDC